MAARKARAVSARAAKILQELESVRDALRGLERDRAKLQKRRDALMVRATAAGATGQKIAAAAGVTPGRVSQLAPATERPAPAPLPAAGARGSDVRELPAGVPLLSGESSARMAPSYGARPTAFARVVDDSADAVHESGQAAGVVDVRTPAGVLAWCVEHGVTRLFTYGASVGDAMPGETAGDRLRAWAQLELVDGWRVARAGHYLSDVDAPVFRWEHDERGAVELHTLTPWASVELDAAPATVAAAWRMLSDAIAARFGARVLASPATTGRDLWARSIPAGRSWPVLSDELRELIAATSGQGRSELVAPPRPRAQLDGLTYMDGRFMYAALTWGMPVGAPVLRTARDVAGIELERVLAQRGRWRVRATVPDGWGHVGILPASAGTGAWRYPRTPGERFETWADAAELRLAHAHGWPLELVEGMTWKEGKPLDVWRDKLVQTWAELEGNGEPGSSARIAARMVRAILLHAIGAFASRSHRVTRSVPESSAQLVPAGAQVRVADTPAGRVLTWDELQPLTTWSLKLAHPEWSAQVWARARVRLLDAPAPRVDKLHGGTETVRTGALHVDPARVVAFRTDALYLSGEAPAWPDDGAPGRFRVKGYLPGRRPWPTNLGELFALRDAAELETSKGAQA